MADWISSRDTWYAGTYPATSDAAKRISEFWIGSQGVRYRVAYHSGVTMGWAFKYAAIRRVSTSPKRIPRTDMIMTWNP